MQFKNLTLRIISSIDEKHNYSSEIKRITGISNSTSYILIKELEQDGLIKYTSSGLIRRFNLTKKGIQIRKILLGLK